MKQDDYKAIAEIIKGTVFLDKLERVSFCTRVADYFEREDKDSIPSECTCSERGIGECHAYERFDKRQFLKDCGVEE